MRAEEFGVGGGRIALSFNGRTLALSAVSLVGLGLAAGLGYHYQYNQSAGGSSGVCAQSPDSLACKVCLLGGGDCSGDFGPSVQKCPQTTAQFLSRFPEIEAKLEATRKPIDTWRALQKEGEVLKKKDTFCTNTNLDRVKKALKEVSAANPSAPAREKMDEFRTCSDAQIARIKNEINAAKSGHTGSLHKRLDEMVTTNIKVRQLQERAAEQSGQVVSLRRWMEAEIKACI
jgi:hypothetical protein